jgi:hypothetical protein
VKEQLAALERRIAVPQVGPSLPDGFYLAAEQSDSRLVPFLDVVVIPGLAVQAESLYRIRASRVALPVGWWHGEENLFDWSFPGKRKRARTPTNTNGEAGPF